jgi:hypothetical protein
MRQRESPRRCGAALPQQRPCASGARRQVGPAGDGGRRQGQGRADTATPLAIRPASTGPLRTGLGQRRRAQDGAVKGSLLC